jgi:hypothetical protein
LSYVKHVAVAIFCATAFTAGAAETGFAPLFDGESLKGWHAADPSYWTVEDGAITARISAEHPCTVNQYLVLSQGELADFEVKLESRVNGQGGINNGFQFRSRLLPDNDICGYQVDNNLQTPWLVRLYDEYGRHDLALRGERTLFDVDGNRSTSSITEAQGAAWFRLEDWHEYHLTCVGGTISLRVDGRLAAEVQDNDERRAESQGVFALQLHSGPPTVAQFRNIHLKVLKPATAPPRIAMSESAKQRQALFKDALAWWPLDTGAHGAKPTLQHFPAFYELQLNVRAAGPGATPGGTVVLLDGAYFDGGSELQLSGDRFTIYLRVRDPKGIWNAALFSKRESKERTQFNLCSADLDGNGSNEIAFEVFTDQGRAVAMIPVSKIDATAWHDLIGRYNGSTLDLFCDGTLMASSPLTGNIVKNSGPLLIAAEKEAEAVVRQFHGELEEAAIWQRDLTNAELLALSGKTGVTK